MADITYPAFFPFADADTATGSQIVDLLYDPASPAASLSVLNGTLTFANLAGSFALEEIHTQRASSVEAIRASANANLDYRPQVFGGFTFDQGGAGEQYQIPLLTGQKKTYIPGANVTHFYHWPNTTVVAMWSVMWNAHIGDTSLSKVYFHIDGTIQQPDARNVSSTFNNALPSATTVDNYRENFGYRKARTFHGHYVSPNDSAVAGGWHTIGLGVVADPDVIMTRIHARDIVVLLFKSTGS